MPIEFKSTDTRTLQIPVPADDVDTEQLGKFLVNSGQDGYRLSEVATLSTGQRDPIVNGLRLTVSREP
jgi:hypothetical protein